MSPFVPILVFLKFPIYSVVLVPTMGCLMVQSRVTDGMCEESEKVCSEGVRVCVKGC